MGYAFLVKIHSKAWKTPNNSLKLPFCRVEISASEYPLPCIDKEGSMQDWFNGLSNTLMWNGRGASQKPLENNK